MEKIIEILLQILDILTNPKKDKDERETPDVDYKGEATLGIIVGHTRKSGGAVFNHQAFRNEYEYNSRVAEIAKSYADLNFGSVLKTHVIFRDGIGISGAYRKAESLKCDMVIELHFNAFNGTVEGTETLATSHIGDQAFAKAIQEMQCKVFNRTGNSRGVKTISRSGRGGRNVHSFPNGYNCLVEPFFGDNAKEAKLAYEKQEEYAEQLIEQVISFSKNYLGLIK